MDSTDKGKPSAVASGVIRRAAAIAFGFGKSQLTQHSYFPNSTATEKDTACSPTAAISRSVLPKPPPNGRPDLGGGHPLPQRKARGWIRQIRENLRQQRAVSFGERQRSPLDSENLSLRNILIFRIQQRRRRIPLAPPLQLFPVLSHIPIASTCFRRKDGRPR